MASLRKRNTATEEGEEVELLDESEQRAIIDDLRRRNERDNAFYRVSLC